MAAYERNRNNSIKAYLINFKCSNDTFSDRKYFWEFKNHFINMLTELVNAEKINLTRPLIREMENNSIKVYSINFKCSNHTFSDIKSF